MPHVLAIVAGTTVDFPNNDRTYHSVFSLSKTRASISAAMPQATQSHPLRPPRHRPRLLRHPFAHERVHPRVAHRYFAVTDEEGRYHIDNVPPGSYNVVAWYEAMALDSRRAAIPEGGGDIELSFLFEKR